MVNENFNEFIKTEAKHKSVYLGSDHKNAHDKYEDKSKTNTRSYPDISVGAVGRDVFTESKRP